MGKLSDMPATSRIKAYDYCNATWINIHVTQSGEVKVAHGQEIAVAGTVAAPNLSGGIVLGSGSVVRVIVSVPSICCSGDLSSISGSYYHGAWIGGRSGTGDEPIPGSGCVLSGHGLFVEPGHQKELFVRKLEEIHVAGVGNSGICGASGIFGSGVYDGWPVTYIAETVPC